jgi:hypothetical protein
MMREFEDIPDVPPENGEAVPEFIGSGIAEAIRSTPPTRLELAKRRRAAVALSAAWFTVQFLAFGVRGDLPRLSAGYLLALVAVPFSAGMLAIVAAYHRGRFGLGSRPALVVALALVCPLTFLLAGLGMPTPYAGGDPGNLMSGAYCLNITMAWTLLPIVSAGVVLRRAFVSGAIWRSALLGAGCGLVAAALFNLHCPVMGKLHIVLAHGGAVVISVLGGGLLLSRFTRA